MQKTNDLSVGSRFDPTICSKSLPCRFFNDKEKWRCRTGSTEPGPATDAATSRCTTGGSSPSSSKRCSKPRLSRHCSTDARGGACRLPTKPPSTRHTASSSRASLAGVRARERTAHCHEQKPSPERAVPRPSRQRCVERWLLFGGLVVRMGDERLPKLVSLGEAQ